MAETMRVWGSNLRLVIAGVMLLLMSTQSQSVGPQASCGGIPLQNITQPEYKELTKTESQGVMRNVVAPFLGAVQPRPFPRDLFLNMIQSLTSNSGGGFSQLQSYIPSYFTGFLIGVGIFLVYVVLMPLTGLILACCRCCGNCGGKLYQKKTNSHDCERRTFFCLLLITSIIIFAANVYMFVNNQAFREGVDRMPKELKNTLNNVLKFTVAVQEQISTVINEASTTVDAVSSNLDDFGPQLGIQIQERFRSKLNQELQPLAFLDQETRIINIELQELDSSLDVLGSNMTTLQEEVRQAQNRINSRSSTEPSDDLDKFLGLRPINVASLDDFKFAVGEVTGKHLNSTDQVENSVSTIKQMVQRQTGIVVQHAKETLADIKGMISDIGGRFNKIDFLQTLSDFITTTVHPNVIRYTPEYRYYTGIWWKCSFAVCSLVLLVVLCNCMGMILGIVGLKPEKDPTMRSKTSTWGGIFFLAGSGFSFIFSWILMIVVLVLFFVTGNLYTLVCRPLRNGELLEAVDSVDSIANLDQTLGFNVNISVKGIYRECKDNKPLWTAMQLHKVMNLDEILNVSQYVDQVQQQFNSTNINLPSINLLSLSVQQQLRDFSTEARSFDATSTTQEIDTASGMNLNSTADELDRLSVSGVPYLEAEAKNLRRIQATYEMTIIPQLEKLKVSIQNLQSKAENISGVVEELLASLGEAETYLRTETAQTIKTESRKVLDCQMDHIFSYRDWASSKITQEIGRCQPVAGMIDFVDVALCSSLVEPMNLFWSSLLVCLVFFIPSIIFSIRLAKYYRRMRQS